MLNDKPLKIYIHEAFSKERSAEMAAANAAKSQVKPQEQQGQAQQQQEGSGEKPKQRAAHSQQASRQTYSVKVINLAWSTTAEGLAQHFADCPVSCAAGCRAVHGGVRREGGVGGGVRGRACDGQITKVGGTWPGSRRFRRHIATRSLTWPGLTLLRA
jgi:hypothetical protein